MERAGERPTKCKFTLESANTGDGRLVVGMNAAQSSADDSPQNEKSSSGNIYAEYHHKDHLGNVRVAFTDRNDDHLVTLLGTANDIEVTQQLDYYPFGLQQQGQGLFHTQQEPGNRYLYNGKEFIEEVGLLDYGARWYDPSVARWSTVDPMAEVIPAHSPYAYTFNNPISYNDPTGMMGNSTVDMIQDAWDSTPEGENRTFIYANSSGEEPNASLKNAFGKALENIADANAEAILEIADVHYLGDTDSEKGLREKITGYPRYKGLMHDERSFKNVVLVVDGQKVVIDELILFPNSSGEIMVSGANGPLDKEGNAFDVVIGPLYQVVGPIGDYVDMGAGRPKIRTSKGNGVEGGSKRVGTIVVRGCNADYLNYVIKRRTSRKVVASLQSLIPNDVRRDRMIGYLRGRNLIGPTN